MCSKPSCVEEPCPSRDLQRSLGLTPASLTSALPASLLWLSRPERHTPFLPQCLWLCSFLCLLLFPFWYLKSSCLMWVGLHTNGTFLVRASPGHPPHPSPGSSHHLLRTYQHSFKNYLRDKSDFDFFLDIRKTFLEYIWPLF